jgi:DNA-binding CsgD family transcriptional regulator
VTMQQRDSFIRAQNHTEDVAESMYAYYLQRIIDCCQRFYGSPQEVKEHLVAEISIMTCDTMHLSLHQQPLSSLSTIPYVAGYHGLLASWSDTVYGSLHVKIGRKKNDEFILPIVLCERLARDCAWCLHVLENEERRQVLKRGSKDEVREKIACLSIAQRQVLELMVKGLSTRSIAETLHISKRTVETHQRRIYLVLDVHSQKEAILLGMNAGLLVE